MQFTAAGTMSDDNGFEFDGMWPYTGYGGMMVRLAEEFVKSRQETSSETNPQEDDDENENFVSLKDVDTIDEASIFRIRVRLDKNCLHMADGVLRRFVEGCCPPKIKITRLDEETTMKTILGLKQEGNRHFVEKGYREAIDCYDAALESVPSDLRDKLHVAPKHQITELLNILSNKAECLLRKAKYEEAAEASTEALIFDARHEKSRLRRAKASLEIGMYSRFEATSRGDQTMIGVAYLVQARHDLHDILEYPDGTEGGRAAAKKVLVKVDKLLAGARNKVLEKDPNTAWDMSIIKILTQCW